MHSSACPVRYAGAIPAITAGAGQDNVAQTGVIIDRATTDYSTFVSFNFNFSTVLAAAATLTLKNVVLQHGDDSALGDVATFSTLANSTGDVVATGPSGGGTVVTGKKHSAFIGGAKRYIRVLFTFDLSASGTDTLGASAAIAVFDPPRDNPTV